MATKKKSTSNNSVEKAKRVPISDVQEVQDLVDLKQEIDSLKAENPEVFMRLADLVDRYNSALELAANKVRSMVVSCGPFDNYSASKKYNPEKMYEELGEDLFLASGGSTGTVKIYRVDPSIVDAAIASGKVPKQCVDEFRTISRNYHAPEKINI